MTKFLFSALSLIVLLSPATALAEDVQAPVVENATEQAAKITEDLSANLTTDTVVPVPVVETVPAEPLVAEEPQAPAPSLDAVPTTENVPAPEAPVAAAPVLSEVVPTDNLEFISGEVSSVDEPTQSVLVKLYGETESGTSDKTLKVTIDSTTDITDGEQDRDLKSLTAGTEVDVEYDPASNKATYIFVY